MRQGVWLSGWTRFVRCGQIVGLLLGDSSGDRVAVWVSVSLLGFDGRFRCPRWRRCSEDLFSKAMRSCKDFNTKLSIGARLFGTELVFREVVPTWGNIKTIGAVVVPSCSTTRGRLRNCGKFLSLVSSQYKVVSVMSIWAGGFVAELELGFIPPGVSELGLGGSLESDMGLVGTR